MHCMCLLSGRHQIPSISFLNITHTLKKIDKRNNSFANQVYTSYKHDKNERQFVRLLIHVKKNKNMLLISA